MNLLKEKENLIYSIIEPFPNDADTVILKESDVSGRCNAEFLKFDFLHEFVH